MRNGKAGSRCSVLAAVLCLMVGPLTRVNAQIINPGNAGNNAIWADSTHISPSTAYIDADVFATANGGLGGSDLCAILNYIYTNSIIPAGGAVIDARGIAVGQTRPCTVNPWNAVSNPPPTTVLLPSGGIFLEAQWTVPSGTHLIGERRNTNIGIYTTNSIGSGYMIQMGPLAPCSCPAAGCAPVVLEQIVLQPNVSVSTNVSGIDNECSGPLSYLDHIAFFNLAGVGVKVGAGAAGSGPYTDLSYTAGDFCKTQGSGVSCPSQCVNLQAPTRGVHGITCTMKSDITTNRADEAAIIVDGQNSIEDIHIEGFYDGVLLGNTSAAAGSTLLHLTSGNGGLSSGPVLNTVHICNPASPAAGSACTSYSSTDPGDITISDVTNNTGNAFLIKDDVTSTNVGVPPGSAIEYVTGVYVLGESVAGGYSRFSTSPATTPAPGTPTWGAANLGSNLPSTPCPAGSVFSNTGGSTKANTVYVCEFSGSSTVWNAVN